MWATSFAMVGVAGILGGTLEGILQSDRYVLGCWAGGGHEGLLSQTTTSIRNNRNSFCE
jgi:hypothetical protein